MQLRSNLTVHSEEQNAVVLGLEVMDLMVKTTLKQLGK